jgi:phosphoglucosamine mutase
VDIAFGTDGVRGLANRDLTAEHALGIGRAAARTLGRDRWLIARDTRHSGPMLESALAAGLASEGARVELLGIAPTPALAWLCTELDVPGAMISASHNPFADNGIKLFAAGGRKLTDATEADLLVALAQLDPGDPSGPTGRDLGTIGPAATGLDPWTEGLVASIEGRRLDGLTVVLDGSNGSNAHVAPDVLRSLGATVHAIGDDPDGANINDGVGSTNPESCAAAVVAVGADVGLAFDGDADRVVAVDHQGRVVDGDHMMALLAIDRHRRGTLAGDTVVVTVMTNLGFHRAMVAAGIAVEQTQVGDRYVLEALERGGWNLGGEQSGHVILTDISRTGDGLLTGLHLLDLVQRSGRPLADLAAEAMTTVPQLLRNVEVRDRSVDVVAELADEIAAVQTELGDDGRVLVRPSGTEPLVRVMVEAVAPGAAEAAAARLVAAVERVTGPA